MKMSFELGLDFIEDTFIQHLVRVQKEQIDDALCKFLENNGYKIDKPYNVNQLEEIRLELAKQDKFVNFIDYTDYENKGDSVIACHYIIPFFDSISNPLDEDYKNELILKFKELHKGENNE